MKKIKAYGVLIKFKLNLLVVISALLCYATVAHSVNWITFWLLAIGGFLVTGAANAINQIIEKDLDQLMVRTEQRPLVTGEITEAQAAIAAGIMAVLGTIFLFGISFTCGFLGALAVFLYTVVYTPTKLVSPFSVFVGAIPGSIPPLLGAVAATGTLANIEPWIMFGIQFLWQFPHFWAIAWRLDDDYKKAGFKMLPSGQRDKSSAFQVLIYSFSLVPMSLLPVAFGISGMISAIIITIISLIFAGQAYVFYKTLDTKKATTLMFGSFFYLPIIQVIMLIDKI